MLDILENAKNANKKTALNKGGSTRMSQGKSKLKLIGQRYSVINL